MDVCRCVIPLQRSKIKTDIDILVKPDFDGDIWPRHQLENVLFSGTGYSPGAY